MSELRPDRIVRGVAWVLALAPFLWLVHRFDFVCDDAYISFRYARNFASGLGLVFNPGVEPPVEGYSELLWVLAMAVVERLGLDPGVWSRVLSVAAGVAVVGLTLGLVGRRLAARPAAFLGAALFLGCLPPLAVWSTGGMGTMPFTLAVLGCFAALFWREGAPRPVAAGLAAALAVLLRADGMGWIAVLLGGTLAAGLAGKQRALVRAAVLAALPALAVFLASLVWRRLTYGDWWPNTARVKVGLSPVAFERGANYLVHFLLTFPALVLVALLALPAFRRFRDAASFVAFLLILVTATYAVVVGGDFMCFGRFLVPALPFAVWFLAGGLAALEGRAGRVVTGIVAAALAALSLLPAFDVHAVPESVRGRFRFRWNLPTFLSEYEQWHNMRAQGLVWAELGKALAAHTSPGDSLVYGAIGGIGYYSNLFMYDRNGLVTREVSERDPLAKPTSPGHDKAVPKAFFKKDRPTYLDAFLWPADEPLPAGLDAEELIAIPLDAEALGIRAGWTLWLEPYDGH